MFLEGLFEHRVIRKRFSEISSLTGVLHRVADDLTSKFF